jgi:ATP-dependent RNA helicase DDX55/SPB4
MVETKQASQSSKPANLWPDFLENSILKVIKNEFKFESMTPVQSVVIPIFAKQHKDVVVEAITGSGKTLSFVVPILDILLRKNKIEKYKKHNVGALIISPTRELAQQTFDVINTFLQNEITSLESALFVGGQSITKDISDFIEKGANIVVGTAGRLEDLLTRQNMTTSFRTYFKNLV